VSNPGDVERVATKVVPYYVVGVVDDSSDTPKEGSPPPEQQDTRDDNVVRRARPTWIGFIAAALGVATLALLIVAMAVATAGNFSAGTWIGYITVVVSISAAVIAGISLIFGYRRRWAAGGLALAILANPLVLVTVFRFFGG
jgi:hypothetical protein